MSFNLYSNPEGSFCPHFTDGIPQFKEGCETNTVSGGASSIKFADSSPWACSQRVPQVELISLRPFFISVTFLLLRQFKVILVPLAPILLPVGIFQVRVLFYVFKT